MSTCGSERARRNRNKSRGKNLSRHRRETFERFDIGISIRDMDHKSLQVNAANIAMLFNKGVKVPAICEMSGLSDSRVRYYIKQRKASFGCLA